jgi:hypothetical protein
MVFSKTFPKTVSGSTYPIWEEIFLTIEEENEVESLCREENFRILDESIRDARSLAIKNGMNSNENVTSLGIALFEKRASHEIFWKESKAKDKFDQKNRK